MVQREVLLADGMTKVVVDGESKAFGFSAGDIITADERHAKWQGKQVKVVGFTAGRKNKVVWALFFLA